MDKIVAPAKFLPQDFSVTDLHDLFLEAAQTLRLLPAVVRKQRANYWPEYVRSYFESYGYHPEERIRIVPSARQIQRMEMALELALDLKEEKDRKIIWAVAQSAVFRERGPNWSRIGKSLHCSSKTAKRRYEKSLLRLYYLHKKMDVIYEDI